MKTCILFVVLIMATSVVCYCIDGEYHCRFPENYKADLVSGTVYINRHEPTLILGTMAMDSQLGLRTYVRSYTHLSDAEPFNTFQIIQDISGPTGNLWFIFDNSSCSVIENYKAIPEYFGVPTTFTALDQFTYRDSISINRYQLTFESEPGFHLTLYVTPECAVTDVEFKSPGGTDGYLFNFGNFHEVTDKSEFGDLFNPYREDCIVMNLEHPDDANGPRYRIAF